MTVPLRGEERKDVTAGRDSIKALDGYFQRLMPMLSAQKNVEVPLLLTRLSAAERKRNASIALQLVGLSDRATHKPKAGYGTRISSSRCWPSGQN